MAVPGEPDGAVHEQLHDDVRQTGCTSVPGCARRRTELRDLSGVHVIPEEVVVAAAIQRVAGRGQLRPAGSTDHQTVERLRGEHRLARQTAQPDQHDIPIGRRQRARADIAVSPNEYDQTHNVTSYFELFTLFIAEIVGQNLEINQYIIFTNCAYLLAC